MNHIVQTSITKWYPILKWEKSPNFQTCHTHDDFEKEYHKGEATNNFIVNILESIDASGSTNARLIGKMGSGKTTFLHYLKKIISKDKDIAEKTFFSIIRASKVDDFTEYENMLQEIIINESYKNYFTDAGFEDDFLFISTLKESNLRILNYLKAFYNENKPKFKKSLIVVLDDMDTLKEDMAYRIGISFKKILGSGSMSKWISIRGNTYDRYSAKTKDIFTFFAETLNLPTESLYEIISKRIKLRNGNSAKNPFSKSLCDRIMLLHDGSIRDSLATLKIILQYVEPKTEKPEAFIQNWLEHSAITALLLSGEIPNVHSEYFVTVFNYPIAYDLLHIIEFSHIKSHIYSIISKIAQYDRNSYLYNESFNLLENQLDKVMKTLEYNNLIKYEHDNIRLTPRAKVILTSSQNHYNNTAKMLIKNNPSEHIDSDYWKTLSKTIEYKRYAKHINMYKNA